jgi:hypothetical protein
VIVGTPTTTVGFSPISTLSKDFSAIYRGQNQSPDMPKILGCVTNLKHYLIQVGVGAEWGLNYRNGKNRAYAYGQPTHHALLTKAEDG